MSNVRRKSSRLRDISPKKYVYDNNDHDDLASASQLSLSQLSQVTQVVTKPCTRLSLSKKNQSKIKGAKVNKVDEHEPISYQNARASDEESFLRTTNIDSESDQEILKSSRKNQAKAGSSTACEPNFNSNRKVSKRIESDSDDFEDIGEDELDLGLSTQYSYKFFVEQCILNGNKNKSVLLNEKKSKEKMEKLEYDEIQELLKSREEYHLEERKKLLDKHWRMFGKWQDLLVDNFNLLLYGVGSKKFLLDEFSETKLKEKLRVVVHGFFPSLTMKEILNSITTEALDESGTYSSPSEHVLYICDYLEDHDIELYLIIHNIDGASLANEKSISVLSQLARSKHIHIVATVDHTNSGLLFDTSKSSLFKWLWFDVTTFERYKIETAYENSMPGQQTETLALSSLRHVYLSLTPNAQGIFKLLAKSQLEKAGQEGSSSGLSFAQLFRQCREAFLVNSDLTLRTQLIEFKDHKMLKMKKGGDGLEYLFIPVNLSTLTQFLEETDA